jgi:hypothetical protein
MLAEPAGGGMKNTAIFAAGRAERTIVNLAFLLLFPGFFFYHTLLGTGITGAFLAGYFAPVAIVFMLPLAFIYIWQLKRDPRRFAKTDLYFALYLVYFLIVVVVNAAAGANFAIVTKHILEILFLTNVFILFKTIDFEHMDFRIPALLSLFGMSAIIFSLSVDGVFFLGALGAARDAESLATYQGFSRSYLFTVIAVIPYTRLLLVRLALYCLAAASLFINTARSEFAALLFVIPIIEFYFSKQKFIFILVLVSVIAIANIYLDQIVAALPDNRILELLDLSQSTSANKRHYLSLHAMQIIAAHPIFGEYASYAPGYYSHNILSAWVDLGIFGIVFLLLILIFPALPMFIREYFAPRNSGNFVLGFSLACITLLLLFTSHYFTDMLIGATLGAYSKYRYENKYAKDRASDVGTSAPRYANIR